MPLISAPSKNPVELTNTELDIPVGPTGPTAPVGPCGIVNEKIASVSVPSLTTEACEPGSPVVVVPTLKVAPPGPGTPVGPTGPVSPL